MTTNLLDKHPGSRRYVAHLHSYGATRAQICTKLAEKFPMAAPTTRSMTAWLNGDPDLVKMIAELDAIKADMTPDDPTLAELPEPRDRAQDVRTFWLFLDDHPAFAALSARCSDDPDFPDDVWLEVLREDHADDAAFEAACRERVGDYDPLAASVEAHLAKHHSRSYAADYAPDDAGA